jgi:hypothetical protein
MSLYLLHLEPRYLHAAHYLGYTDDTQVERRRNPNQAHLPL